MKAFGIHFDLRNRSQYLLALHKEEVYFAIQEESLKHDKVVDIEPLN